MNKVKITFQVNSNPLNLSNMMICLMRDKIKFKELPLYLDHAKILKLMSGIKNQNHTSQDQVK